MRADLPMNAPARSGPSPNPPASVDRYAAVRSRTVDLCAPLEIEDYVVQSMTEASPAKWHLGHTTWFFETFVLAGFARGYRPYDPAWGYLFNSYYNTVGERVARPKRGLLTRPTVREVIAYRRAVDAAMADLLREDGGDGRLAFLVELGLNHEQQHQELLLTDLKHLLSQNPLAPVYSPEAAIPDPPHEASPLTWTPVEGGLYEIGDPGGRFAYDNEGPRHKVWLDPFEIADRPVTNREYLRFMDDGGYRRPELWLDEGWARLQAERWEAPLYWRRSGESWRVFTLGGDRPLVGEEPACHLSFYEAEAYARWAGARLPEEAEWEVAARGCAVAGNFAGSRRYHPRSVPETPAPLEAIFGDLWEWTGSAYRPYPGFRPPEGAVGEYNGKFMCGQFVLRGGSCATPEDHVRSTYRNFFYPDARWQFSGVRLARRMP